MGGCARLKSALLIPHTGKEVPYLIHPVEPKKVLCIHDLSGMGRCSLAVILPVLSVMGVQPVALPTVVLSTHTGGLGTPARLDGCAYGEQALEHYHALGVEFDCIYTGYLGGEDQVALAEKAFALWPAAKKIVDPVMGDNGKAYSTVTPALIDRIRALCGAADLILPNYTEAQILLQRQPQTELLTDEAAQALADELTALAPGAVVTGLPLGKYIGCAGSGKDRFLIKKLHISRSFPGTGDLYGAVLIGSLLQGNALSAAADNAAEFVALSIQSTPAAQDTRLRGLVRAASAAPVPGKLGRIRGGTPMNEKPTLNIVLVEPRIPQNTGNVARTCACTACRLHLVGPMGFAIDDKKLKHAGLDYWHYLDISYYDSLDEFFAKNSGPYYYFTTKAPQRYTDVSYPDGAYLVFGREDAGLPEALLAANQEHCIRMPMRDTCRSLNLSNSVAVGVYEVLRQWDFPELLDHGHLRDYEWK